MNPPELRWFQLRLKSLFLLTLVVALFFGAYSWATRPAASSTKTGGFQRAEILLVDGSSAVYPITKAVAVDFQRHHPHVDVRVGESGTGGGFQKFIAGATDISNASRPISRDEFQQSKTHGVKFLEIPVAYQLFCIVVSRDNNWVQELTIEQVQLLFLAGGAARNWSDLDPCWPNAKIEVHAPGTDEARFDHFQQVLGRQHRIRSDLLVHDDDAALLAGVGDNRHAVGFYDRVLPAASNAAIRVVPIVNPQLHKAISPTQTAVAAGDYLPSRPLFIYVNEASLKRPHVRSFVEHYLDTAGRVAEALGFVPLPRSVLDLAKEDARQK